jgi:catechol 2,3-dioxygenase-like lactoylglutathione lyase family enzyme
MIKTYGLTHIAISVQDIHRSSAFYENVFGAKKMYATDDFIQLQTPNSHDIIVLEKGEAKIRDNGGIKHFGFRLIDQAEIDLLIPEIEKAGGTIKESGEFCPGEPYIFFYDPDGYEIELWYEKPVPGFN